MFTVVWGIRVACRAATIFTQSECPKIDLPSGRSRDSLTRHRQGFAIRGLPLKSGPQSLGVSPG